MKLVSCSNLVIGTNGLGSVCCGKHVGCNTGTCDQNRTFETILQSFCNQLPDILKPSGWKSSWNQAAVFFVGFRLFALRDKSSRDKVRFLCLFRWKTKLRRPYAGTRDQMLTLNLGMGNWFQSNHPNNHSLRLANRSFSFSQHSLQRWTKIWQHLTVSSRYIASTATCWAIFHKPRLRQLLYPGPSKSWKNSELRSWLCFGRKRWIMDANAEVYWLYWKWTIWTHRRPKKRQGLPAKNC